MSTLYNLKRPRTLGTCVTAWRSFAAAVSTTRHQHLALHVSFCDTSVCAAMFCSRCVVEQQFAANELILKLL
jgi:hypothetical protein